MQIFTVHGRATVMSWPVTPEYFPDGIEPMLEFYAKREGYRVEVTEE